MTFEEKALQKIREASASSSFYIGCDSSVYTKELKDKDGQYIVDKKTGKVKVEKYAKYILMFIVHYDSNKGGGWIKEEYILPEYGNLKQRLLNEANFAIGLAANVIEHVGNRPLEVHLDINPDPKHKSHVAVKEALAYAKGMGLDAKIKPDSFAASHAADQLT